MKSGLFLQTSQRLLLAGAFVLGTGNLFADDWTGHDVSEISSDTTICLYNVATGYFLNQGGYWGTQPQPRKVGLPLNVESTTTTGVYRIQSHVDPEENTSGYISYVDSGQSGSNWYDYGRLYMDRVYGSSSYGGDYDITFTQDESYTAATAYKISVTPTGTSEKYYGKAAYWVVVQDSGSYFVDLFPADSTERVSTDSALWVIVTLGDLLSAFDNADASSASPADATFLLYDQNFHRNNSDISYWNCSYNSGTSSEFSSTAGEIFYYGIGATPSSTNNNAYQGLYGQFYAAHIFLDNDTTTSSSNQQGPPNQNQTTTTITYVTQATVSQTVTITRSGWYSVSCAGFYLPSDTTSSSMSATLFAEAADQSVTNYTASADLYLMGSTGTDETLTSADINTSAGYLLAGRLLTQASTEDNYLTTIYVYVNIPDGSSSTTLTLGVEVTDGNGAWVAFDDVQLAYLGSASQYIVLDENDTQLTDNSSETTAADDDSTIDLNKQLANAIVYGTTTEDGTSTVSMSNYALVLARPLVDGEWNSIILPVDLTPSQLNAAFGSGYRLARFTGVDVGTNAAGESVNSQTIKFTSVAHTESLHAGYLYIVKPVSSNLTSYTSGTEFTTPMPAKDAISSDYKRTIGTESYYLIPQVSFPDSTVEKGYYDAELVNEGITAMPEDGTLAFHGTYIKQASRVPKGSYVVGKSNGVYGFYHYTGTNSLTIKGFRTWIEPVEDEDEEETVTTSSVYFTIDGSVDPTLNDAVSTGIVSLPISTGSSATTANARTDNRVYSLSGQLLREGSSLEGLAQGVYIVNGEKYIVK